MKATGLAAALILLLLPQAAAQDPVTGRASVVDGDTIEVHGERIRFHGIDAPESWQRTEALEILNEIRSASKHR